MAKCHIYIEGKSYTACDKCIAYGKLYNNRNIYPNKNSTKRTDESFWRQEDENHHLSISLLLRLKIGMISSFPIDYMPNICLRNEFIYISE